jgi:tRNA nucleotidyltransferase (CCA-adding enzyme)
MNDIKIIIPKDVEYILDLLNKNGFEAYIVGGCLRDILLQKEPKDWDIATSAFPEDVKKIFTDTYDTGLKHGTVSVKINNVLYEVTTFRTDIYYDNCDNRHPSDVVFVNDLISDLSRRDFTINALAYNKEKGLIDYFGGLEDLKQKKIKAVGDANERFKEDALRILRAIRFSAVLGFSIEKDTQVGMYFNYLLLNKISKERIQSEINKILTVPDFLNYFDWFDYILRYACELQEHEKFYHTTVKRDSFWKEMSLGAKLFVLLKNMDYNSMMDFLKRLKYDNKTIKTIQGIYYCYKEIDKDYEAIYLKTYMSVDYGSEKEYKTMLKKLLKNVISDNIVIDTLLVKHYLGFRMEYPFFHLSQIYLNEECYSLKDLDIDGYDVKDILNDNLSKVENIGLILDDTLQKVIEGTLKNDFIELKKYIEQTYKG